MTAAPATRQLRPVELEVLAEALASSSRPATRERRRVSLLAVVRRPSRTAQLEQLLGRYRWANAGLRERLAQLTEEREDLLDALAVIADEEARVLGHAHPVIVRVRAQLDAAAR